MVLVLAKRAAAPSVPPTERGLTQATEDDSMAQAISIPNTTPTRRNALGAIASIAGAAVTPAIAAQSVDNPDAELLALGQELCRLLPIWAAARDENCRLHDQADDLVMQAVGPRCVENMSAYNKAWLRIGEENGHRAAYDAWNTINEQLYSLTDAIYKAKATTVAGLAVKALGTAWRLRDDELEDSDVANDLFRSTLALAGMTLPPEISL